MRRSIVLGMCLACRPATPEPGSPGEAGVPGADGADGPTGPSGNNGADGAPGSLVFEGVGFASTDTEKREIRSSARAWVDGAEVPLGFQTVLRSGDPLGDAVFGRITDHDGAPVAAPDGSPFLSVDSDFTSLLDVDGALSAVTHFESAPGAMYLTALDQDPVSGLLTATSTAPIDFAAVGGLWVPCAGSTSPWGTHLGSQEYPPDARAWAAATSVRSLTPNVRDMLRYFGLDIYTDADLDGDVDLTLPEARAVFDPYRYGFVTEVAVHGTGDVGVAKHPAVGRVAIELAKVLPDERTVYVSDDGTNVGLYLFVADQPRDLSAGNLYAMKWYQTSDEAGGRADLGWIPLGHASDAEITAAVDAGLTFADLFDTADPVREPSGTATGCPPGFGLANSGDALLECLAVRPGMEVAASRLETRRYAALLGATTELRKGEGIAHDPLTNTLFVAVSAIEHGMVDDPGSIYDEGGPNDIRLPFDTCGAVYTLDLAFDPTIGSDYVAGNMNALLVGTPATYPDGSVYARNSCAVSGIANPDNLTFVDGYGTLIVGEDSTTGHQNDVLWAYDLRQNRLDRILSTPYGAETTSPYWYGDRGGFGYLVAVVQHPYGETDRTRLEDPADARASVGFVGPFPRMTPAR